MLIETRMGWKRRHFEAEVLASRLATEREGKSIALASSDPGTSAGSSTTDPVNTDSV